MAKELTGSESGLRGYYKFEGNALDSTPNMNDGTENGTVNYSQRIKFLGSYSLDCSNFSTTNYVRIPNAVMNDYIGSIEFFVYTQDLSSTQAMVVGYGSYSFNIKINTQGQIEYYSASPSNNTLISNTKIKPYKWHHIVCSWSASGKKIYIDGVLDASNSFAPRQNSSEVTVGVIYTTGASPLIGFLDDVKFWEIERNPGQWQNSTTDYFGSVYSNEKNLKIVNPNAGETIPENFPVYVDLHQEYEDNTNVISYYKMSDGSGTTLTDDVGTNNGTLDSSGMWANDSRFGSYALKRTGVNDKVTINSNLVSSVPFTVEFWVNLNSLSSNGMVFSTSEVSSNYKVLIRVQTDGTIWFRSHTGGSLHDITSQNSLKLHKWYHVACTMDAGFTKRIYINGLLDNELTASGWFTDSSVTRLFYNPAASTYGDAVDGIIDDVRVSNIARTSFLERIIADVDHESDWGDVKVAYNDLGTYKTVPIRFEGIGEYSGGEPGLLGLWHLDETSGTTAYDSGPNGYNGTIGSAITINQAGKYNKAMKGTTNNSNSKVTIPGANLLDHTGPMTIELWFKTVNTTYSDFEVLICKGYNWDDAGAWALKFSNDGAGRLDFNMKGLTPSSVGTTGKYYDQKWHHVACVYTGDRLQLFVDGFLESEVSVTGSRVSNTYDVWIFNRKLYDWAYSGDYYIDEVAIWNYPKSPEQIRAEHFDKSRIWFKLNNSITPAEGNDSNYKLKYNSAGTKKDTNNHDFMLQVEDLNSVNFYGFDGSAAGEANASYSGTRAFGTASLNVDASNAEVLFPDTSLPSEGTIELMVKKDSTDFSNDDRLLQKGAGTSFDVGLNGSGYLFFAIDGNNSITSTSINTITLNDGNWHQLAFSWGPAGMKIWHNGVVDTQDLTKTGAPGDNSDEFTWFNERNQTAGYEWKGLISGLKLSSTQKDSGTEFYPSALNDFSKQPYTEIFSEQIGLDDRNVLLNVNQLGLSDRNLLLEIEKTSLSDRNILLDVEGLAFSDALLKMVVENLGFSDFLFKLNVEKYGTNDRSALVNVARTLEQDRPLNLEVEAFAFSDRQTNLNIAQFGFSDALAKLVVAQPGISNAPVFLDVEKDAFSDRFLELNVKYEVFNDRQLYLNIERSLENDRTALLEVEQTDSSDREVKLNIGIADSKDRPLFLDVEQSLLQDRKLFLDVAQFGFKSQQLFLNVEKTLSNDTLLFLNVERTVLNDKSLLLDIEREWHSYKPLYLNIEKLDYSDRALLLEIESISKDNIPVNLTVEQPGLSDRNLLLGVAKEIQLDRLVNLNVAGSLTSDIPLNLNVVREAFEDRQLYLPIVATEQTNRFLFLDILRMPRRAIKALNSFYKRLLRLGALGELITYFEVKNNMGRIKDRSQSSETVNVIFQTLTAKDVELLGQGWSEKGNAQAFFEPETDIKIGQVLKVRDSSSNEFEYWEIREITDEPTVSGVKVFTEVLLKKRVDLESMDSE